MFDRSVGLKFVNRLLLVCRELSHEAEAVPPHSKSWVSPPPVVSRRSVVLFAPPSAATRKLLTGESVPVVENVVLIDGVQAVRACAMLKSEICGLRRSTWTFRFCSSARLTASSIDRRRSMPSGDVWARTGAVRRLPP